MAVKAIDVVTVLAIIASFIVALLLITGCQWTFQSQIVKVEDAPDGPAPMTRPTSGPAPGLSVSQSMDRSARMIGGGDGDPDPSDSGEADQEADSQESPPPAEK